MRALLASSGLLVAILSLGACGDAGGGCDPACPTGSHCDTSYCVSDCAWGCGFNEVCVGPDECELAEGAAPELPDACTEASGCVVDLWAGQDDTCALLIDDSVWCWGENGAGQLASPERNDERTPVQLMGLPATPIEIGFGLLFGCAALDDGRVACWGDGSFMSLGLDFADDPTTPQVVPGIEDVLDVASGDTHMCVATDAGAVRCWGSNTHGQLGAGDLESHLESVSVAGIDDAVAVTAGDTFTCALRVGGALSCWGENDTGQLGDGTRETRPSPVEVIDGGVADAAAAGNRACALMDDETVRCWGESLIVEVEITIDDDWVDFDYDPLEDTLVPTAVRGLERAVEIDVGLGHQCVRLEDGVVGCWGINGLGQLGYRGDDEVRLYPVRAASGLATAVATGTWHSCAALQTGGIACWGGNAAGQLGDGLTANRQLPGYVHWP